MTFDPEQTAREVGCWLLGHDPQPKWRVTDGNLERAGEVKSWCGRCERYLPPEATRRGPVWRRLL